MARRYHRQHADDLGTRIVLTLFRSLWNLISLPFRKKLRGKLNREQYRDHWDTIQALVAHQTNEQHWRQAVLEADKLVDQAFRDLAVPGATFGERLRAAEWRFDKTTYHNLWEAHKLRNQIAHEVGYQIGKQDAETALSHFVTALSSLGAL